MIFLILKNIYAKVTTSPEYHPSVFERNENNSISAPVHRINTCLRVIMKIYNAFKKENETIFYIYINTL